MRRSEIDEGSNGRLSTSWKLSLVPRLNIEIVYIVLVPNLMYFHSIESLYDYL